MNAHLRNRILLPSLAIAAAAIIVACGGSSDGTGSPPISTPSGTTQAAIVEGPVTGFGSMVVNGVRFDESKASIVDDDDQIRSRADLRIGSMVRIEGSADDSAGIGSATKVVLMPSLLGRIDSVNASAGTMVVLGQTVRVDADTTFDGTSGLAALLVGDIVRVHGLVATDGTFAATLIEKLRGQLTMFKVRGVISSVDPTAGTFTVGALKVDYSSAEFRPTGAAPTVGALVKIKSDQNAVAGVLVARKINIYNPRAEYAVANGYVMIKGILDAAPDPSGNTTVSGLPVNLTGARLEGNGNLVAGQRVHIKGVEANGVIQVTRLQFEGWHASKIGGRNELYGVIANFTSPSSFTVNGVAVDASQAKFENGSMSNLADGVYVEIKGNMQTGASGSVLVATKVEFKSKRIDDDEDKGPGRKEFYGAITNFNSIADFMVNGIQVDGSGAKIEDGSASDLRNGVFVEVEGNMQGGKLIAIEIEIKAPRGGMTPVPVPTTTTTGATTTTTGATTTTTGATTTTTGATTTTTGATTTTTGATTTTTAPTTTTSTTTTTAPTTTTTTTTSSTTTTTLGNATRGQAIYTGSTGTTACTGCHGTNPAANQNNILNGKDYTKTASAIASNKGGMGLYASTPNLLQTQDLKDIAAYLNGF